MKTVEFAFGLKQKVVITNINTQGIVIGLYYGENGVQYQVAYFMEGERRLVYLYPEELKLSTDNTNEDLGFKK